MRNEKGFTLIETIIFIVVISVSLVILSASFTSLLENNATDEYLSVAIALCEGKMEEILAAYTFASITNISQTAFDPPFGSYTFQVAWYYVNPGDLNTDAATATNYKHVRVTVAHNCIEPVRLTTILANY